MPALAGLEQHLPTVRACALLGLARASVYRARTLGVHGPRPAPRPGAQPATLGPAEAAEVLAVLDEDRFADKAPEQVWATLLDEGRYLCSVSTMYRILRAHNQVRERRAQAAHPPRVRPELVATGPNQVWSWDVTKLKGPVKGLWFNAYVIIDIYSRKIIHVEVHAREREILAREFLASAVGANHGIAPGWVHSDNGSPMIAKTVAELLSDLGIIRSLSRPHTSNDNPFSEAWNKTLKYAPVFPDNFTDIGDARGFLGRFAGYYNTAHHHSGIGLYTPASVHDRSWTTLRAARQAVLDAAYTEHPERFRRGRPTAPTVPEKAWINRPTITTTTEPHTGNAA